MHSIKIKLNLIGKGTENDPLHPDILNNSILKSIHNMILLLDKHNINITNKTLYIMKIDKIDENTKTCEVTIISERPLKDILFELINIATKHNIPHDEIVNVVDKELLAEYLSL